MCFFHLFQMLPFLAILACLLLAILWYRRQKNLPPGPWCLPILGYLPWIDPKAPYETFTVLSRKYGPVYGLYLGNLYTVVLSDTKDIRNVLAKDVTTGRAPLFVTHGIMKGYGKIFALFRCWKKYHFLESVWSFHASRLLFLARFGNYSLGKRLLQKVWRWVDLIAYFGQSFSSCWVGFGVHFANIFKTAKYFPTRVYWAFALGINCLEAIHFGTDFSFKYIWNFLAKLST